MLAYARTLAWPQGYHAIQTHRIAHALWKRGQKVMALALQSRVSEVFAVDIHPAARIGEALAPCLVTHKLTDGVLGLGALRCTLGNLRCTTTECRGGAADGAAHQKRTGSTCQGGMHACMHGGTQQASAPTMQPETPTTTWPCFLQARASFWIMALGW